MRKWRNQHKSTLLTIRKTDVFIENKKSKNKATQKSFFNQNDYFDKILFNSLALQ